MDGRRALPPGAKLKLFTPTGYTVYTVRRELGRGGSCIVYDASYTDNLNNYKLVRIKECCPHALRLARGADGALAASERDAAAFNAAKARIIDAYQKNHALFAIDALTNTVANTSNLYEANGTVYVVSTWLNGRTFADYKGDTLRQCIALALSTARVLKNIHDAGYLYLDLKPENILTIRGSLDLVQLFDFDSMIAMDELRAAEQSGDTSALRTSYTRGFAPLELQTGRLRQIGPHSDIYSLGAVLFDALWHRAPTAFDCAEDAEYDFSAMEYASGDYQYAVFRELTTFFHKTLASYHGDRYGDAAAAIEQLRRIYALTDESRPWLISTSVPAPLCFEGRKSELDELSALLRTDGHNIFNLCGMGGIGKSTLARAYIAAHRAEYDALLWLYDRGDAGAMLCDDLAVRINAVSRLPDEPRDEYLRRKLRALTEIASRQRVLVVVDDVQREHLSELRPLLQVGWDVLLISRAALADGLYPTQRLSELDRGALALLFSRYAHMEPDGDDTRDFDIIADSVRGHTLTVELLARQVASNYMTLREAAALVGRSGFSALPAGGIDYIHDQDVLALPLTRILDRLVEIDRFTAEERRLLQILTAFDRPGIRVGLLRELTSPDIISAVNRLEACGWLTVEAQHIVFHPLMREYIDAWPWTDDVRWTLDDALTRLHRMINPEAAQPDLDKQFPKDYAALSELLTAADQLLKRAVPASPASQLLRFRALMDAPVDMDDNTLDQMLALLAAPEYLEPNCVLRLYETAAFLLGRRELYDDAFGLLKAMRAYLKSHKSRYYTSWYYRALAVLTNNRFGPDKSRKCREYTDAAIKAARASRHPDAGRQLAAVLLNKAQTLIEDGRRCDDILSEAGTLLGQYGRDDDYELYHYHCVLAVYRAVTGDESAALEHMRLATEQAYATQDSPLSFIEHLLDEETVVYIQLNRLRDAADTVIRAIAMCDAHEDIRRYREARFDAYMFLGRIYAMNQEYVKSEDAYNRAERFISDARGQWSAPLCPKEVRRRARAEKKGG